MEAFDYHKSTKHSYYSVRSNPNYMDWDNPPSRFKIYPSNYEKIKLDINIDTHKFIMLSFGITAKKTYPNMEYYLRINPSAGALYPNEIYFQVRNQNGFKDGIYHYEVLSNKAVLLEEINEDGLETFFGYERVQNGFIFLVSNVYYRSSWKYKNRAFRYCMLDSGHLLGCLEASSYLQNRAYRIAYDFDKNSLNKMFGFKQNKSNPQSYDEFFSSSFHMVFNTTKNAKQSEFTLEYVDPTSVFEQNEMIEFVYNQTKLIEKNICDELPSFNFSREFLEETILKRRSIREFTKQAIAKYEFESIMRVLEQPIPSDCDEEVNIYCVINRVKEMPMGVYKDGLCLKEGDFMSKAGYLCLEQDLGQSSAVTFFLTSAAKNYQALYQKAGIIGQRLYLASNYLGYGCSGIGAYYDDEVNEFLKNDEMVLYALAIGN